MVNADLRSAEVIKRLAGIDFPSVAEIGVYEGEMSRRLLYRLGLHLLLVDTWGEHDDYPDDPMSDHDADKWHSVRSKAFRNVAWAEDRVRVFQGTSMDAAEYFEEQFDLVFLDGAHDYANVQKDIAAWWQKVTEGGWLSGHDYGREEFGVTEAVEEFAEEHGLTVELGHNYTWFIRK